MDEHLLQSPAAVTRLPCALCGKVRRDQCIMVRELVYDGDTLRGVVYMTALECLVAQKELR